MQQVVDRVQRNQCVKRTSRDYLLSLGAATQTAAEVVTDPDEPLHCRVQLSVQSEFHVPLDVRLFRPVMIKTLATLSHDHPLTTASPLSLTFET